MNDRHSLSLDRDALRTALIVMDSSFQVRTLDEFSALDDCALYARRGDREAIVCICDDVSWGPEISTYVERADEWRALDRLTVDVPNDLSGRTIEVVAIVHAFLARCTDE